MTTSTPDIHEGPSKDEPNTPTFKCAVESCGHRARTHAENGYGPCSAKSCSATRRNAGDAAEEDVAISTGFVFESDPLGTLQDEVDAANADEDAAAPKPEETMDPPPDVETTETRPDDAAYDPSEPFDPSRHLRILRHTNRKTQEVSESHYLDVKWRMVWLRSASGVKEGYLPAHPKWRIEVDSMLSWEETLERRTAVFRARLWDTDHLYVWGDNEEDDPPGKGEALLIAEGHGSQSQDDWHDYIEKAETKAIGRCLISAGYGTAAAAEFEEGENISEGGVAIPQGQDATPIPECPHGHGTGPVRRIMSKFGEFEGQEIFWCAADPDGRGKCNWTISVAQWEAQLAGEDPEAEPVPGDPGDPNKAETEAEAGEGPSAGESRTASSGSGAGPSTGSTGSAAPSASGTRPAAPSAASRTTRPAKPGPRGAPAFEQGAVPILLTKYGLQMPQVMARWEMTGANPAEIARILSENDFTLEEMFAAAAEVTA